MLIRELTLQGFRNIKRAQVKPNSNLNVLLGPNGAGKTNFCEGIYFMSTGETLKGSRQNELIGWNSDDLLVRAHLDNEDTVAVYLQPGESKTIKIDSKNATQSDLRKKIPVLTFVPDDLYFVKGGPARRRKLIDDHLSLLDPNFTRIANDYERELKKKNALLKKEDPNEEFLNVLNRRLAETGAELTYHRVRFIKALNEKLPDNYGRLTGGQREPLQFHYQDIPGLDAEEDELQAYLAEEIEQSLDKEREIQTSVVGPHRHKISYRMKGRSMRKYGSQGEQRSCITATKLALLELYYQRFEEWPVLILDDILSELDHDRGASLLNRLPSGPQMFITATEKEELFDNLPRSYTIYLIRDGRLQEEN